MTGLGTWAYPWDIADHGTRELAGLLQEGGVGVVHVAMSYHSLLASVPDNPVRSLVELPTSALYVEPDAAIWDGARLAPVVSPVVEEVGDAGMLARELGEAAGCATSAWTVTLHDTSIGGRCPDAALTTAWRARVSAVPCVRHPAVRDFARRLVRQVVATGADQVQLESPCWTTLPHHRHTKLPAADVEVVQRIAELCFCERCREAARAAGIDVDRLATDLTERFRRAHTTAGGFAELAAELPDLPAFLEVRTDAVTGLVAELVGTSTVPVEVVCFGDRSRAGLHLAGLERAGASVRVLAYGPPEVVDRTLRDEARADDRPQRLGVGLSLLPEHVRSEAELADGAEIARSHGADSVSAYHLGLVTHDRRRWLRSAADGAARAAAEGAVP